MKNNTDIQLLYGKYLNNQLSAEEIRDMLTALGDISQEDLSKLTAEVVFADAEITENSDEENHRLQQVLANIRLKQQVPVQPVRRNLYTWLSSAAAILLISGAVLYFSRDNSLEKQAALTNLQPGKNQATLTLANGSHIALDDAANGNLANQTGVQIVKTKDGQLVYKATDLASATNDEDNDDNSNDYNTIETPKGGQYMVILPDNSKVWLNAGSALKYPASFANSKNRMVELKGEAYFEVAKEKTHPFIVKTDKQEVQVLGTHFNINSYSDEPSTLTTLLEGSVRVSNASDYKIIRPGEQAALTVHGLKVSAANTEEAIAWKNGYFRFNDEKIESIMRKIARWYNVEVEFQGEISEEEYNGKISRFKSIAQVLDMLGSTNTVHFKIEGRRILVIK